MALSEPDDFLYHIFDPDIEEDTRYVPGGYHPTIVGDILGESPQHQYRIVHKLGCGSFSTVWLAQRTERPNAFVSLKITIADDDTQTQTQEVQMLQKVNQSQSQSYVVKLLDHFRLHGPNGTHTVIVTDVVVPTSQLIPTQSPAWQKAVAYGLAQGLAQLHADRIVHGDLHLENTGIAMPQLADQDYRAVLQDLGDHELTAVLPYHPAKQTASLPPYLISSCDLGAYYQKIVGTDLPKMKILDFGGAHEIGTHSHVFQCVKASCAPEIFFALLFEKIDNPPLDPPSDVWALATTIYEIIVGGRVFHNVDIPGLPRVMTVLGRIPPHWNKWSASLSGKKIPDADKWWDSQRRVLRARCENDEDANALLQLFKKVFVLDPAERPTAAEIVNDPWFQTCH